MLGVKDFDPKGTISEVRVHSGAKFGQARRWSIAKCRFSSKGSFDHHGKAEKENVKLVSKNEKTWTLCRDLWEKMMYTLTNMHARKVEKCEDGKDSMIERSPRGVPKREPTRGHCVYRFIVPVRWGERRGHLIIVCGASRPTAWRRNKPCWQMHRDY